MSQRFDPYHRWLGIPQSEQPPSHYRLLGIAAFESDPAVIHNAALQRLGHLKTVAKGPRAEVAECLQREVHAAARCLLQPSKRAAYDARLRGAAAEQPSELQDYQLPAVPVSVLNDAADEKSLSLREPADRCDFSVIEIAATAQPTTSYALRAKKAKRADKRRLVRTSLLAVQIIVGGVFGLAAACFVLFLFYPQHPILTFLQQSFHGNALPEVPTDRQPQGVPTQATPSAPRSRSDNLRPYRRSLAPTAPSKPVQPPTPPPVTRDETPDVREVVPRSAPSAPAIRPADFNKFALPSGKPLSPVVWNIPATWHTDFFPEDASVYVDRYPNGQVRGVYSFDENSGVLDGWSAALREDGKLSILANYHQARRDGPLRVWDDAGNIWLYAQYTRGRLDGLACLFRDGVPWFIEEWEAGDRANERSVVLRQRKPAALLFWDLNAEEAREAREAKVALSTVLAQMEDGERELKKSLSAWYRSESDRIRRERAVRRQGGKLPASKKNDELHVDWRGALRNAHPR